MDDLAARMSTLMAPVQAGAGGGAPVGRAGQIVSEQELLTAIGGTDFRNVESLTLKTLDPNLEYESVITKVTPTRSKETKNPMIALELKVCWPMEYAGVKLWDQCVLTDTAMWKAKSLFDACALLADGKFTGQSLQELVGFVVRHQVINEVFRGRPQNKIAGSYGEAWETPGLEKVVGQFTPDWAQPTGD